MPVEQRSRFAKSILFRDTDTSRVIGSDEHSDFAEVEFAKTMIADRFDSSGSKALPFKFSADEVTEFAIASVPVNLLDDDNAC